MPINGHNVCLSSLSLFQLSPKNIETNVLCYVIHESLMIYCNTVITAILRPKSTPALDGLATIYNEILI